MTVTILILIAYTFIMFRHSVNCYLIDRMKRENELQNIDKSRWYAVNDKCLSSELVGTFYQSSYDSGTENFIARCYQKSASIFSMFLYAVARSFLKIFMSSTSVCGLLGCGSMFVFSEEQFKSFVVCELTKHFKGQLPSSSIDHSSLGVDQLEFDDATNSPSDASSCSSLSKSERLIQIDPSGPKFGAVLDLGAGDGNVTSVMSPYFHQTYATEISRFMHSRLSKRGYELLDPFEWNRTTPEKRFDLISLLNVLDRCDKPLQMLADIHAALRQSDGLLLLAIVFPLYQYVEYKPNHQPDQVLPVEGTTFEHQVASFHKNVLLPAGFECIRWTKLPYLCEGNIDLTYFWLIDAVFLLKTVDVPQGTA